MIFVLMNYLSPHCKNFKPVYEEIARAMKADEKTSMVEFGKVDAQEEVQLRNRFKITGIPAIHMFQ